MEWTGKLIYFTGFYYYRMTQEILQGILESLKDGFLCWTISGSWKEMVLLENYNWLRVSWCSLLAFQMWWIWLFKCVMDLNSFVANFLKIGFTRMLRNVILSISCYEESHIFSLHWTVKHFTLFPDSIIQDIVRWFWESSKKASHWQCKRSSPLAYHCNMFQ